MNVESFLTEATQRLTAAGITTARLDSLVFLEDELGIDRASLLAHLDQEIVAAPLLELNKKIAQRAAHMPLAYIRGKAEFYGREFFVNDQVLVPRPESEKLIDLLRSAAFVVPPPYTPLQVADVGAGSGCLGITAALEFPGAHVNFFDIDSSALTVAIKNAKKYRLEQPHFYEEDLLVTRHGLARAYDAVLANLPYVPDTYQINEAAGHEPKIALFGGKDGLNLYRKLWRQISGVDEKPKYIITESFPFQHEENAKLAKIADYSLQATDDFAQRFVLI